MKHAREEAYRWLAQAEHDLLAAQRDIDNQFFADACYSAEQSAQKALKGYLYFKGKRVVWEHSVRQLTQQAGLYQPEFLDLIDLGTVLDQYYVPTRYPDALAPPAVPFESYNQSQAEEAIRAADKIVKTVTLLL